MTYQKAYYPKRPVKSFQDLEVYQKLLAISVALAKRINSPKITVMALDLPVKLATAHSQRFGDQTNAIQALELVMLNCNILVVYLEQYRDIENAGDRGAEGQGTGDTLSTSGNVGSGKVGSGTVEPEFFEEQIKNLLTIRMKILHLQNSWKKFAKEYAEHDQ